MATEPILEIVREVASNLGIGRPNTATGSTDPQIVQLVSLASKVVQELCRSYDWQELIQECSFVTTGTEDQGKLVGGIIPAGKPLRKIINNTLYNRTTRYEIGGPVSPSTWQGVKAVNTAAGFYAAFRLRGNHLLMTPPPAAGQSVYFEYVTENPISNAGGDTFKLKFDKDDDFPLVDSTLVKLGLAWRWKAAKGFDYAEDFNDYERARLDVMTGDGPKRVAMLDRCTEFQEIRPVVVVPISNWLQ